LSTALTTYFTNAVSSTLATAAILSTTAGGGTTGANSVTAQALNFGECYSQGNAGAWAAAGSIGSPSGNGWFIDATSLEGQQIPAGNWTPTLRGQVSGGTGNLVADIYVRAYNYTGGIYTQIGSNMILTAQTFTNAVSATYTFTATSQPLVNFFAGGKLYIDIWCNVTTNSTTGTSSIRFNEANASNAGSNTMQVVTPGYVPFLYSFMIMSDATRSGLVVGGVG
jgi:hypothetical protein